MDCRTATVSTVPGGKRDHRAALSPTARRSSWYHTQPARRQAIRTDRTQHLRAEALLILAQEAKDAWQAADAISDLGQQFGDCPGTEAVKMLSARLEAKAIEGVEVDHGRPFGPMLACTDVAAPLFRACQPH